MKSNPAVHEDAGAWDKQWEDVANRYYWHTQEHSKLVEQYLHGKILDVGCGPGFLASRVWPNEGWYTGIDFSPRALQMARALFPGAHFEQVDVSKDKFPFPDGTFDTVICSEVLEHLLDQANVLAEVKRVSRDLMLFSVPVSMNAPGHVWPDWTYDDVCRMLGPLGKFIEIRVHHQANTILAYMRK